MPQFGSDSSRPNVTKENMFGRVILIIRRFEAILPTRSI